MFQVYSVLFVRSKQAIRAVFGFDGVFLRREEVRLTLVRLKNIEAAGFMDFRLIKIELAYADGIDFIDHNDHTVGHAFSRWVKEANGIGQIENEVKTKYLLSHATVDNHRL